MREQDHFGALVGDGKVAFADDCIGASAEAAVNAMKGVCLATLRLIAKEAVEILVTSLLEALQEISWCSPELPFEG